MNSKRDIVCTLTPGFNDSLNSNNKYQTRKLGHTLTMQKWIFCFDFFLFLCSPLVQHAPQDLPFRCATDNKAITVVRKNLLFPN